MKEAKTFGELYAALSKMKTDLESEETIDSVDITMDVRTLMWWLLNSSGYANG